MIQKIMLQVKIDDSQLDLAQAKVDKLTRSLEFAERMLSQKKWFDDKAVDDAQAKADKLVATLERADALMAKLDKATYLSPPNDWWKNFRPNEITCQPKLYFDF